MEHCLPAELPEFEEFGAGDLWLMQDGDPAHIGRNVRAWMQQNFEERVIGRYGKIPGPAQSRSHLDGLFRVWVGEGPGVPAASRQPG